MSKSKIENLFMKTSIKSILGATWKDKILSADYNIVVRGYNNNCVQVWDRKADSETM